MARGITKANAAIKERLQSCGAWHAFLRIREGLKARGMPPKEAWVIAAKEFPEHEYPSNGSGVAATLPPPTPKKATSRKKRPTEKPVLMSAIDALDFFNEKPAPEPAPTQILGPTEENPKAVFRYQLDESSPEDSYVALCRKIPVGCKAKSRDVVLWVFENIDVDWSDIDPAGVPSRGALSYMRHVRGFPANRHNFFSDVWARTIPSKGDMEQLARYDDDGGAVDSVLNRVAKWIDRQEATDGAGQLLPSGPSGPEG